MLCPDSFHDKMEKHILIEETGTCAHFGQHTLYSYFQPIYSLSMQQPVGYEALMRAWTIDGLSVAPPTLFASFDPSGQGKLDVLSHLLHLNNFQDQSDHSNWLFLNMTPNIFLQARHAPPEHSFGRQLEKMKFPANLLVVEVLEETVQDNAEFESAVAFFRDIGCLIALDDFGAGSSNFDRVWKIRPQIVKLDRSLIRQAAQENRVRRILPQIVSLLHEAGAMVLIEGIETQDEACIALDADADFAQGYLLGHPHPQIIRHRGNNSAIHNIWSSFEQRWQQEHTLQKNTLAPYMNAIGYASVLLSAGRPMDEACAAFLELPDTNFCYLIDQQGQQVGFNLWSAGARPQIDARLLPLKDTHDARLSRRPYFRRAIENFGKIQVSRPYLSISSATLCITVSISFKLDGQTWVICGDVQSPN